MEDVTPTPDFPATEFYLQPIIDPLRNETIMGKSISIQKSALAKSALINRAEVPRNHIAFIKTHKCASSTIQNMLMRYGFQNKLQFALPKDNLNHLGWPRRFEKEKDLRKMEGKPDILCYHSVFTPDLVSAMPGDTFYFTVVREPISLIKSSYLYYNLHAASGMTLKQLIGSMNSPYTIRFRRIPIVNPMLYDLGLPKQYMNDTVSIQRYIDMLDKRIDLVMVVDYFDESLVILRDMLGWSDEDMLIFSANFRRKTRDSKELTLAGMDLDDTVENRRLVSSVSRGDFMVYQHFKTKLERVIATNKMYIEEEVKQLRLSRQKWMKFCLKESLLSEQITDERFRTSGNGTYGYVLTEDGLRNQTCVDLAMAELPWVARLDQYQLMV